MADQLTPTDDPFLSLLRPQEQHMNSSRLGDPNVDMKTALEEWQAGRNTGDLQDVLSVHELCHRGQSPADMEDRDITYVEWDSIQNVIDGNTQHNGYPGLHEIVKTQGRNLRRLPDTPTFLDRRTLRGDQFVEALTTGIEALVCYQHRRARQYGADIAEKWPISRTPPEIVHDWHEREQRYIAEALAPTPPTPRGGWDTPDTPCHGANKEHLEDKIAAADDKVRKAPAASQHQPTPPDSLHRLELMSSPLAPAFSESDSEDCDNLDIPMTPEHITTPMTRALGQIVGKKRNRDISDLGEQDSERSVKKCQRTTHMPRSYFLRSTARFLKAG